MPTLLIKKPSLCFMDSSSSRHLSSPMLIIFDYLGFFRCFAYLWPCAFIVCESSAQSAIMTLFDMFTIVIVPIRESFCSLRPLGCPNWGARTKMTETYL
jgi:hypothetical protein